MHIIIYIIYVYIVCVSHAHTHGWGGASSVAFQVISQNGGALKIRDNICISVAFFASLFSHAINTSFTREFDRCEPGLTGVRGV